ncbi:LysR family transcriptional regulator [Nocardia camponoti]|uniref:LysR family transcriptional regulator n=1 Tax=Nocardia camponoti TaxID=1616106 RepID=A0A917Q8I7_9NOCA|nr:LysR family transcriptional regulator [Nocardia camponoti]GGK35949.1 LysR family transcriptional regulator [Nocardia camponoti]
MDLVAACQAFVAVSGRGSFTDGAAAVGIPQSVASRRIAALEARFGARLLNRTSRSATLTAVGQALLPTARRLVDVATALEDEAERAKTRPLRIAVPTICASLSLARLVADAKTHQLELDVTQAGPAERAELARTREVRVAVIATPPDRATWRVPLGVADTSGPPAKPLHLAALRPTRANRAATPRRVWVQPEDDVPHVRDRLTRSRDALGLHPSQVVVANTLVTAIAATLDGRDLLLCSPAQATDLGLAWRPIGEHPLTRGYDLLADDRADAERVRAAASTTLARCLGATGDDR